mgnify:CR=1 FL=1
MIIAQSVADLKREIARLRAAGQRIAFVPTLGNLHAGHRHLMEQARRYADAVVASIYVNPLQFGPGEDLSAYPRTPEQDRALLGACGVELLFFPDDTAIYPRGRAQSTRVEVPEVSDILCGAVRPGHFRGVATVVHRLFQIVTPDVALFGKKDYQQLLVIRLMTADFGLPIEIVGVDTVRDADGLAMSSRNVYLTATERRNAPKLAATLQALAGRIGNQGVSTAMDGGSAENAGAVFRPTAMDGGSAENAGAVFRPTAMDGGSAENAGAVFRPTAMDGGSAENAGAVFRPTAMDGGSAENAGADFRPTAMDGGRFGLLPSRGITPSMEGRSAEREAVPPGTNAGAVFRPESGFAAHEAQAAEQLTAAGFRPEYVSVRCQQDLALPGPGDRQLVILAAAWLGRARLIDNLELELKPAA